VNARAPETIFDEPNVEILGEALRSA